MNSTEASKRRSPFAIHWLFLQRTLDRHCFVAVTLSPRSLALGSAPLRSYRDLLTPGEAMSIHSRESSDTQSPAPSYATHEHNWSSPAAPIPSLGRRRRLGRPVALPQCEGTSSAPIVRAWAPALHRHAVGQEDWLDFINQLNIILRETPEGPMTGIGRLLASERQKQRAIEQYLAKSNHTFFHPRGLSVQLIPGRTLQEIIASDSPPFLSPRASTSSFPSPSLGAGRNPPKRRFSQLRAAATSPTARTVARHAATVSMFVPILRKVVQRTVSPDAYGSEVEVGAIDLRGDMLDDRLDAMAPFIAEVDRDVPALPASPTLSSTWWEERVHTESRKQFAVQQGSSALKVVTTRLDPMRRDASRAQQELLEGKIRKIDPEADLRAPTEILWLVVTNSDKDAKAGVEVLHDALEEEQERERLPVRGDDSGYASVSSASGRRESTGLGIMGEGRSTSPVDEDLASELENVVL